MVWFMQVRLKPARKQPLLIPKGYSKLMLPQLFGQLEGRGKVMSVDVFSAPIEPIGPNVRNSKSSTSANPIPSLPSLEHQCPDVVTNLLEKESQA